MKIGLRQLLNDLLCSQCLKVLSGQPVCSTQRQEQFEVPRDLKALSFPSLVALLCASIVLLICVIQGKIRFNNFTDNYIML